jgi:hypothetical protein
MYIALHYVSIGKRLYTKGEIINEPLTEEKTERLIRLGAIRAGSEDRPVSVKGEPPLAEAQATEDTPVDEADEDKAAEGETTEDEDSEDEAAEEEAAPPEIDVMDGLVTPEQAATEAPEATTPKVTGAPATNKKPAGRGNRK